MKQNREDEDKRNIGIKPYLFPMVIAAGIIPLIVRVYPYTNDELICYDWFSDVNYPAADLFLAYKSFALQWLLAAMLIIFIYGALSGRRKPDRNKAVCLLIIYALFVIISGLVSASPKLAFKGSYERFEPVGAVIAYLMIFIYSYNYIGSEEDLKDLFKLLAIPVTVVLFTGTMQGAGLDPFRLPAVKRLITPTALYDSSGGVSIIRNEGVAYITFYNENYTGIYLSMLIPVFFMLMTACRSRAVKAFTAILLLAGFYVLYHSDSMSGWMALIPGVGIPAMLVLCKNRKVRILLLITLTAVSAGCIAIMAGKYFGTDSGTVRKVTDIETGDKEVVFTLFDGNELHCSFEFDEMGNVLPDFTDKDGNVLKYYERDGACILEESFLYADASVAGRHIQTLDADAAVFLIDGRQWPIVIGRDKGYYYLNYDLKPVKYPHIRKAELFGDGFMNGRGDIWNKCLYIMKDFPVLGCGANLFITAYPQDDYIDRTYRLGRDNYDYDVKAHSFYLGSAVENGLLATLCLAAFFVYYLIKGARLYTGIGIPECRNRFITASGLGMYSGCLTYMIASAVNDSNVCTAPVFWMMLGASMAVNENLLSV